MFKQKNLISIPTYEIDKYKPGIADRLNEIATEAIENNFDLIKKYSCLEISTRALYELGINSFTSCLFGPNKPNYLSDEVLRELTDYVTDGELRLQMLGMTEFQSEFWNYRLREFMDGIWAHKINESRKDQLMMNALRTTDNRPAYDYINRIKNLQLLLDAGYDNDQLREYTRTVDCLSHNYIVVPRRAIELVNEGLSFMHCGMKEYCEALIKGAKKAEQDADKFISEHTPDDCMQVMRDAVKSCYENMMLTFTHLQSSTDRDAYFKEMLKYARMYEEFSGYLGCFENVQIPSDKVDETRGFLNGIVGGCDSVKSYVGYIIKYLKEE